MKTMKRLEFLKALGRWGAVSGIAVFGAALLSRESKVSCNEQCGACAQFKQGKCEVGIK